MAEQVDEGLPEYIHIEQNDFFSRKHKKQKEEDIATCECKFESSDPDSTCGERCLNVLTSTECTPEYCPCGIHCKNQRFQKCQYAKLKLFITEGRGWGILADENIKAGTFIIEYCGEVISWKEARRRAHSYENQGLKDAFIISLNAHESIDATRKGSLARFINHSCQPNCETRKWNVLGEIRVGIFAKQDIVAGTELAYDYNFEWYGGAKVRCLCGASSCSSFLGAKSRGFQEANYLWEDDDARYSVDDIPLYDSEEDKPHPKMLKTSDSLNLDAIPEEKHDHSMMDACSEAEHQPDPNILAIVPHCSVPMEEQVTNDMKTEENEDKALVLQETNQTFVQKNAMISRIRSNSACRNYYIQTTPLSNKRSLNYSNGRLKQPVQKEINTKLFGQFLASTEAREEVDGNEERKKQAASELDSVYNEIRPAIEEHEKDSQDSVSTSLAEKWIEASCMKLKAEFDLYSSIIKHVACTPRRSFIEAGPAEGGNEETLKK
ncbi:hypothetical protein Syun_013752 [Stephania yunnanensis]|uniref:Histone-lysine N-methyltransferase ASHH1 n=1 Tax=Stephania yunnanensis TaxID=152371 RepID=A0AAP0P7X5_9MAGN